MALAKLELVPKENAKDAISALGRSRQIPATESHRFKVYLAGGFKSGWQDALVKAAPFFDYVDPRVHGLSSSREYIAWDLEAIRRSDCVFAYLEPANPGGYALALEVGFAKALGKFVIDEKSQADAGVARYLQLVRERRCGQTT